MKDLAVRLSTLSNHQSGAPVAEYAMLTAALVVLVALAAASVTYIQLVI